jgi:hypothetical protein
MKKYNLIVWGRIINNFRCEVEMTAQQLAEVLELDVAQAEDILTSGDISEECRQKLYDHLWYEDEIIKDDELINEIDEIEVSSEVSISIHFILVVKNEDVYF